MMRSGGVPPCCSERAQVRVRGCPLPACLWVFFMCSWVVLVISVCSCVSCLSPLSPVSVVQGCVCHLRGFELWAGLGTARSCSSPVVGIWPERASAPTKITLKCGMAGTGPRCPSVPDHAPDRA